MPFSPPQHCAILPRLGAEKQQGKSCESETYNESRAHTNEQGVRRKREVMPLG